MDIFPNNTYRWQKAHEKVPTSLVIGKVHIKSTVRYYLTPVRRAIIKKDEKEVLARM